MVAGEAFDDVVVEVARAGEAEPRWVHRVRSLVLTDAAGEPDCLVLVLHDATERFEAEERFERAFGANPAPAVICRLADLRYVKVNQGFLEMTGYKREEVIGRSVYEIDVLERAERRGAGGRAPRRGPHHPADGSLPPARRAAATKFVVVAGQPIEIGDEPLHAVHLHGPRAAQAGRRRAAPERGALRQVVPAGAGADDADHAATGSASSR